MVDYLASFEFPFSQKRNYTLSDFFSLIRAIAFLLLSISYFMKFFVSNFIPPTEVLLLSFRFISSRACFGWRSMASRNFVSNLWSFISG